MGRQTPGRQFRPRSRANRLRDKIAQEAVLTCVRSYREHMAKFSAMRALDVWYARFEAEELVANIKDPHMHKLTLKGLTKAKSVCMVEDVFPRLADASGETPVLKDNPPHIYHHLEHGEE